MLERWGCVRGSSDPEKGGLRDDRGQDLAEYAMLGALIAVVVIAAMVVLGSQLTALWNTIAAAFAALP